MHDLRITIPGGHVRCEVINYQLRDGIVVITVRSNDFIPGYGSYPATWQTTTHEATGTALILTCSLEGDTYTYGGSFTRQGDWINRPPLTGRSKR